MTPFSRPGVSDEFLCRAGCAHVGEDECARLYGFAAAGIAIPFRRADGAPLMEGERPFARVRLYDPTDHQKYHQKRGSGVHIYIPPTFTEMPRGSTMMLVEGEFKALALAEAGFVALGLCGLTGAAGTVAGADGERRHALNPELVELLESCQPAIVIFLGDADVAMNAQFAVEAAKLRRLLGGSKRLTFVKQVLVCKPPLGGPKGVDDVRSEKAEGFCDWFNALLAQALDVPAKASGSEVFCDMLKREAAEVKALLSAGDHDARLARTKLLRSAAQLWTEPGAKLDLAPLLCDALGVSKTGVGGLIRDAAASRSEKLTNQWRTRRNRKRTAGDHRGSGVQSPDGHFGHPLPTPSGWFDTKYPKLAAEHGDAILEEVDKDGIVSVKDIGEDFLAATLGETGNPGAPAVFLPTEDKFYIYARTDGVFVQEREPVLLTRLSRLLLDCARACQHGCETRSLEFRFRDSASLSGVLRKARGLLEVAHDFFSTDLTKFIPCANGMLRLSDKALLPFSPSYRRRNKLAVPFDPTAKCPLFLDTLMRPALDPDELDLLQRWCGLALIGENLAQKIVILTGTAGGGKGTFVRVLNGIIGQTNLASLRPQLLGERFELGRFLGKTLLYGADVPANFLNQHGASVMKSLTGYDPMTLEFKNSNETPSIICRFNVIVSCNSRLTVHLEGDADAWRRRLVLIPYEKPKPQQVIADLDRLILTTEASGVLNHMVEGLDKVRAAGWQLHLTNQQQRTVDNLLLESDGNSLFVREALIRADGAQLTVPDCFSAYVEFCNRRGWAAQTRNKFGQVVGDEVARVHGLTCRHDILDASGKAQRGWRGLALREKNAQPTGETVSEVSENQSGTPDSDSPDTLFPVHPEKNLPAGIPQTSPKGLVEEFV